MSNRLNIAAVISEWERYYRLDLTDWDNTILSKFYAEYGEVLGVTKKKQAVMLMLNAEKQAKPSNVRSQGVTLIDDKGLSREFDRIPNASIFLGYNKGYLTVLRRKNRGKGPLVVKGYKVVFEQE